MCRLFAITSTEPVSPMVALEALDVMREGHDCSGVGIFLRDLAGPFDEMKDAPILSGIFSDKGLKRLDTFMMDIGFMTKYKITVKLPKTPPPGVPKRDVYLIRAYEYPEEWEDLSQGQLYEQLLKIRLQLRAMGEEKSDMIVFARVIMAQGRQNTNYAITLYACHPFFIQGYSTMTNGENTAFVPIRSFLESRGFPGYTGYQSDSEVFTHILHYAVSKLGLGIEAYKHVITPLQDEDLKDHPNRHFLKNLKQTCRPLIIDGPNCVIGCLPDHSVFMVQDRKKLRPGVVGGKPGVYAFSSEICGLDAAIPNRDKSKDFQPMHLDTVVVGPGRQEVMLWNQKDPLPLPH
jgi:predicted glutamine amidotransferase